MRLTITGAKEMGQACGAFYDATQDGSLVHIDSPVLNRAVANARRRNIGTEGGWGWNRKDTTADITPLVAATLAMRGLTVTKRLKGAPGKGRVIGLT